MIKARIAGVFFNDAIINILGAEPIYLPAIPTGLNQTLLLPEDGILAGRLADRNEAGFKPESYEFETLCNVLNDSLFVVSAHFYPDSDTVDLYVATTDEKLFRERPFFSTPEPNTCHYYWNELIK